ncbi:Aldolase-type TIM barrel family protein [Striga hermonthica]|uniref:Aldolase-type TIM barrel family protein n=1 Tax=Striga hermonthica TaxID=68872 RepID=A0A9N7MDN7_STRHE|nr:Aldolase-type TIM barrel family protein [Striga hermonthica]
MLQGLEAGGHVIGQDGLITLLPRVVDLVQGHDIPVIAAGGIVDERGYVAALALGAHAVAMGTRFLATEESYAHPIYKAKLVELQKTEYTDVFGRARWPGAPHRVLTTPFFMDWRTLPSDVNESNQPIIGRSVIHGVVASRASRVAGWSRRSWPSCGGPPIGVAAGPTHLAGPVRRLGLTELDL